MIVKLTKKKLNEVKSGADGDFPEPSSWVNMCHDECGSWCTPKFRDFSGLHLIENEGHQYPEF